MNPFASLQFSNRKAVISTAIAVMVMLALYNRSNNYQIVSNSLAESVCSLGKKFRPNYIHLKITNFVEIYVDVEVINSPLTPQNDPCMISIIRQKYLTPPSTLPLNLSNPDVKTGWDPSYGQSKKVLDILKNKVCFHISSKLSPTQTCH
jgi:hypothetical protein